MIDRQISFNMSKVIACALWAAVFMALTAAWVAELAFSHSHLAMMFGFNAACMSAVAAVRTIRCYAVRLANLTRTAYGLEDRDNLDAQRPELHAIPHQPAR